MGSSIKEKGRRIMSCCRDCGKCKKENCGLLTITVLSFLFGFVGTIIGGIEYRAHNIELLPYLSCIGILSIGVFGPIWWQIIWKWEDILHGRKEEEL